MAYGNQGLYISGLLAGADLSSSQYKLVKMASTAGEVVAVSATTDVCIGILQNAPADGEPAEVQVLGVSKVQAGATAITQGAILGWSSTARATARTAAGSRQNMIGIEASAAAGDIVTVLLSGYWRR